MLNHNGLTKVTLYMHVSTEFGTHAMYWYTGQEDLHGAPALKISIMKGTSANNNIIYSLLNSTSRNENCKLFCPEVLFQFSS